MRLAAGAIALLLVPAFLAVFMVQMISSSNGTSQPSADALADIPADYLALYRAAAHGCPGLDWSILAAVGKIETDHGRSALPGVHSGTNSAGAAGPMQFLQATFDAVIARHPLPPGGAAPPSRYNPHDAIYAAAYYLCDSGADHGDLHAALYAYNHADWYVQEVLVQAAKYAASTGQASCLRDPAPNPVAAAAIGFACAQLGLPYVWGGNGPSAGDAGFDCSGLTYAAYATAGVNLPRTADAQFRATTPVPAAQSPLPGDLVFYGSTSYIHHVGMYIGANMMIDAPDFNQVVKIEPYRYRGDDYVGANRPTT
jgi:cell wall-associated NlpC family hydrolase